MTGLLRGQRSGAEVGGSARKRRLERIICSLLLILQCAQPLDVLALLNLQRGLLVQNGWDRAEFDQDLSLSKTCLCLQASLGLQCGPMRKAGALMTRRGCDLTLDLLAPAILHRDHVDEVLREELAVRLPLLVETRVHQLLVLA